MIGIVTDSTCDIPTGLLERYGIIVVPTIVVWNNSQYRDRIDLQPVEFYQRLATEAGRPTSATPSLPDFQDAYRKAIAQGADESLVLTVSSAMSGVYQMAVNAAGSENIPVCVIDSKGPTMSLGWQVLAAARAREAGASLPEIVRCVDEV